MMTRKLLEKLLEGKVNRKEVTALGLDQIDRYKIYQTILNHNSIISALVTKGIINVTDSTSSIISKIENINILSGEEKSLILGNEAPNSIVPSTGKNGITKVTVSLDSAVIKPENIKKGVTILGVTGTYE